MTRRYEYKPVDQLVFSDDFMFGAVMSDPKICKGVLELLLRVKIDHIEYPELQKPMTPFYAKKGVRLDVYVADTGRVFDVECQSYTAESIGKRARYYQSMLDIGSLARGASYSELKESYVIFICLNDPFEAKLPVYTFERKCSESKEVELGDETHHVIFNAAAYEKEADPEIKAFLAFVKSNKAESDLTREIATVVQTKKFEQSFINEYLAWTLHDQDVEMRGREAGLKAGREAGLKAGREAGLKEGQFNTYVDLIKSGLLSVDIAATKLGMTQAELQSRLDAGA